MGEVDGDVMVVDAPATVASKKLLKRKRSAIDAESLAVDCRSELDELFKYYKEFAADKPHLGGGVLPPSSLNSMVACLIEESSLSFSRLVDEVYGRLKGDEGITLASVRSAVLFVGQRMMYGIPPNPDADVLEDDSEMCLWCWETRDLKLFPKIQRGTLNVRRIARKKIHERISALSVTLSALSTSESHSTYKSDLSKASDKLGRVLNGIGIRLLVEKLKQKNVAEMADKEAKLKEKELIKESARNKHNAEKEKKRLDRELQKEMLQTEKEVKRLQDEALREEKRREKEEAELKKQLKKQQEEAEKDQRRREKEEAELRKHLKKQQEEAEKEHRRREKEEAEMKKQSALQKQATIMERFLKSTKSNTTPASDKMLSTEALVPNPSCKHEDTIKTTTSLMDHAFSQMVVQEKEDLFKVHVAGWRKLNKANRSSRWGVRRNPKVEVVKELKLQGSSLEVDTPGKVATPNGGLTYNKANCHSEDQNHEKLVDGWEEAAPDDTFCQFNAQTAPTCSQMLIRKLLQFDKSPRPAYYGTWRKKSSVVRPKFPLKKDPNLDYDVDSDEEWEEEEPGESLSDCDKDEEEENLEEAGHSKSDDEDESEDGFFVPDGYLSENEGVQLEDDELPEDMDEDAKPLQTCKQVILSDEFRALMRQQKCLNNLTEQALRKSQTLVILNLMHEKSQLVMTEGLTGKPKLEQACLQALCMRACPGATSVIDVPVIDSTSKEEKEASWSQKKSTSNCDFPAAISDSDMLKFIGIIRACSQGINKVVGSLQQNFPTISKSHLKTKVKEISHFVDNHWKVKQEILVKFGLPPSPVKVRRPRSITTFFSKRCLPPVGASMNTPESSPQPMLKTNTQVSQDVFSSNSAQIQRTP